LGLPPKSRRFKDFINVTFANSVNNQLLGIKSQSLSLWVALVYLDTESLQRKGSYTLTLASKKKKDRINVIF
jgi:hypothetical protein